MFAYAWNDEPVQVIDLADFEQLPEDILSALTDPEIIKTAFNANFERTALAKHLGVPMPPEQWRCSSVHALTMGLPGDLDSVAKVLKVEQQKDSAGKGLIKYFSTPCRPTKANGGRTRNLPYHDPVKWQQYKDYNRQDVEAERAVRKMIEKYEISEFEHKLWALDQKINDRGILLHPDLPARAIECDNAFKGRTMEEAKDLTGLDNPNSPAQLKAWLEEEEGITIDGLTKDTIPVLIKEVKSDRARDMLKLRQQLAKTSVKKYEAMQRARCQDGRVRGLLQFYGANRTGRWAGRLVQVQNLPQNKIPDLELARDLLLAGDYELLEMLFGAPPFVLSQLIRTAFISSPGGRFIVSDFSAIEARVIAWLAGETWRLEVFKTHGKIYEASAAQMFQLSLEEITKDLRQKGKIAELALGYGGAVGALEQMGALKMGLSPDELPPLVKTWRAANPKITQLWWDVDKAAMTAVQERRTIKMQYGLTFYCESGYLFIRLPSGRYLSYVNPRIVDGKFDKPALIYDGVDQTKKTWGKIDTYGPKLVENIVQAISRDCLAESMLRLDAAGYEILMHVHDEVILDEPMERDSLDEVTQIMGEPIDWAPGLPLRAEAFETDFYKKD
ncbi:DNA-directed DNA polymerase [Paenibacillus algicola]|uniref:DNA-directed DNA polymerase n=1 Tax=Paenibacillus algicola TaxID=2565926 RepID=A0A4V1G435_9BACL|nr:DNA-directed DNA polymerase [Paenibacillus algicola]